MKGFWNAWTGEKWGGSEVVVEHVERAGELTCCLGEIVVCRTKKGGFFIIDIRSGNNLPRKTRPEHKNENIIVVPRNDGFEEPNPRGDACPCTRFENVVGLRLNGIFPLTLAPD